VRLGRRFADNARAGRTPSVHGNVRNAPAAPDKRRSLIKPFSRVDSLGDDVGLLLVHANRARDQ